MIFNITSNKNEKFKYFKSLKQKKYRITEYSVEGKKSVIEALSSHKKVTEVIMSESFFKAEEITVPEGIPCYILPDFLISGLSSTDTPPGVICTIEIEKNKAFTPDLEKAYIYCDRISDPGNLGTIIRTADAAGFGGVMLSKGCVDLYNPKTVRSSMGSFFRMQIAEDVMVDDLKEFKKQGFQILSGTLTENSVDYTVPDMKKPTIIVIGNESNGVSEEVIDISDECIKIPIVGGAESLNAAIAAAVIMYEVLRERS